MDPMTMMAIGAGLGFFKTQEDKKQANIYNQFQAEKERYSPWTKQHGAGPQQVNPFAGIMQGAMTGAEVSNALKNGNTPGQDSAGNVSNTNAQQGRNFFSGNQDTNNFWANPQYK